MDRKSPWQPCPKVNLNQARLGALSSIRRQQKSLMTRILTYNVHRCVGKDRKLDVSRIADVIAAHEPDIVALQELDVGRARTNNVDQAYELAEQLEMVSHFHPAFSVEEELYGDAILTSLPERLIQAAPLPGYDSWSSVVEPRGALWLAVDVGGGVEVQIINTHLGLIPHEQQIQARALAGGGWTEHPLCQGPAILLGDFNATAASSVYKCLTKRLKDARHMAPLPRQPTTTYPAGLPVLRIDHIFVSDQIRIGALFAPYEKITRVASDHLPLVCDFSVVQ
jgi:endonuclease/exonuclease/phosphatase family metal-dependent hydrolase